MRDFIRKKYRLKKLHLTLLVLLSPFIFATTSSIANELENYFRQTPFPGAILIRQKDSTIFQQGDVSLAYQIGSITKMFTAIAILQLREQGRLQLQDPVGKYGAFSHGKEITIENLLTHTSGIREYLLEFAVTPDWAKFYQEYHRKEELVSLFDNSPLRFSPGTGFQYSSANYILLGLVIEKVSGKTYEDYITENILLPAAMHHTGVTANPRNTAIAPGKTREKALQDKTIDLSNYGPAGGIVSTVEDMCAFANALIAGKLLSHDSLIDMARERLTSSGYGLGWAGSTNGSDVFGGHDGRTFGYSAILDIDSSTKTIIIALSNDPTLDIGLTKRAIKDALTSAFNTH